MPEIVMPRLSDSMEEGTVVRWLKAAGEEVAVGEELIEIETDKATMTYESDLAGTLTEIIAAEGETVAIGAPIARVGDPGEEPVARPAGPVAAAGAPSPEGVAERPPSAAEARTADAPARDGGRPKASPLARRLAKERGIDLRQLRGSGPAGRIVRADVEAAGPAPAPVAEAAPAAAPAPGPETAKGQTTHQELSKLQATIARRMAESKATAPHFYLRATVDMGSAVEARERLRGSLPEGQPVPSFNDLVVKAAALALREHPLANGSYRDGRFELHSRINIGIAVAGPDSLVVPTIFDADRKGLAQIARESRDLAEKVRAGKITPPELAGGTFSVSNLGMYGVEGFDAVIDPPQAAILSVGEIAERPAVREGEVVAAPLMSLGLACDHRILYGAEAARLLARIRALLEEPLALAL